MYYRVNGSIRITVDERSGITVDERSGITVDERSRINFFPCVSFHP